MTACSLNNIFHMMHKYYKNKKIFIKQCEENNIFVEKDIFLLPEQFKYGLPSFLH